MRSRWLLALAAASFALALVIPRAPAQIREDRGLAGLRQALDRLDVVASVLHTGAHPDDENSALMAWLSRGQGARTAYLSATRGEGGQNLIGNELFEALGVIRTEELLAARRFDRAQQFFTPNYEFGYSKTAEETLAKWGRENLVGDFVRVIRQFRPEVIVSRFTGTPSDGHGHHQAAGIATMEAFHAAADPTLYPEYGPPWQAKKLYLSGGGGRGGVGTSTIRVNVGEYSEALGRSYNEVAMEGRSLHRTQSMGAAQNSGPSYTSLTLLEKTVPGADDEPIFSRTTATLLDLAELEPALRGDLQALEAEIDAVRESVSLREPARSFPALVRLVGHFEEIRDQATLEQVRFLLDQKRADFHEAAELAAGLRVEVRASDDTIVPGQEFDLTVAIVNDGPYQFNEARSSTDFPADWDTEYVNSSGDLSPGQRFEQRLRVTVGEDAAYTQPYWLRVPREGDRFVWGNTDAASEPFEAPLMSTLVDISYDGVDLRIPRSAEYRYVDEVLGDRRREVKVVPALSVRLSPGVAVVPIAGERDKEFTVTLDSQQPGGGTAQVSLEVPDGWRVNPPTQTVTFAGTGETASLQFRVDVPARAGEFEVRARAMMGGKPYDTGYRVIAYPHIETRHIYADARSTVRAFDVETRVRNIGYVAGAGDEVADSLRQLGIPITFLQEDDLAGADLSVYDTIVLGIRAYAVRDDLRAYNQRVLDYVRDGGTLVVQYNTYQILDRQFGPYPFTINRPHDRVTVEEAPVDFLAPDHPLLNTPNRIVQSDFDGWVQERGLYFLGSWDEAYTPILASNDPGEDPKAGGLVVAQVGDGYYIYTGYAFFRQLPAGVPGAYRLFANLVSLGD